MATKIVYIGDKPLVANGKIVQVNVDSASSVENVEWHQCPEAVRNYLAAVTYDPSDYSTSQIANYAPATAVVSNYRPIGKTLGGKTYYNQVPGVATPFANTELAGTLKPLDFLRYIRTNTWNVRDLGGWACDGGTVKYGLLFRGGEPSAADYDVLVKELGIKYDLNLRGSAEATWTKSPLGDDVYFVKADAYNWYSLTNTEAWRINLQCVFDAVAHGQPVYFHCAAGADRTGTLACVLEGLLGMSQSDIDKDYELTTFYSGSDTDTNARRRNESEWKGLISAINAKSGNTFRDKCVTFVADGANVYVTYDAEMPQEGSSGGGAVPDIELYNTTNISLNKKYSGNSIVDALGSYICAPVSIDMSKYRYLKVNGAHMSGYGGAYSTSEPVIHKIAFIKNNVITSVAYTNNIALSTDSTSKEWVIDMSKQTGYSDADAVRFMISTAGGSVELSESGIVPAANLHIVATAKIA